MSIGLRVNRLLPELCVWLRLRGIFALTKALHIFARFARRLLLNLAEPLAHSAHLLSNAGNMLQRPLRDLFFGQPGRRFLVQQAHNVVEMANHRARLQRLGKMRHQEGGIGIRVGIRKVIEERRSHAQHAIPLILTQRSNVALCNGIQR